MQSTGQTATHPVSRQSRQSRVMMYAMPSPHPRAGIVCSYRPPPAFATTLGVDVFLDKRPSRRAHTTRPATLEGPRETAVGEAGDDQLADGRDRGFGAGSRGAVDTAPLRGRARSLRSGLAVPDAGRVGARAVRRPDELPPPPPLPRGPRYAQLRRLLLSAALRLPAACPAAGRPDRHDLSRHRRAGGRPGRPQPGRTHRPLSGRDATPESRASPGDARRALLRHPATARGARHLRRRRPLHPAAASDLRPAQCGAPTRRASRGRARVRALGPPHPPHGAARGRDLPRLPGQHARARRSAPGARRRLLARHRYLPFDAPRPAGIFLWSRPDADRLPVARVLPGAAARDARRARALLAPRLL